MGSILHNENTRQLYHTNGSVLLTLDTFFKFFSQYLSPHRGHDHYNRLYHDILIIYCPYYKLLF